MSNTQAERVEALMLDASRALPSGERLYTPVKVRNVIASLLAQIGSSLEDTERLDWLEENCFLGTMDEFDRRGRPNSAMWTFFAPNTVQGSARRILDAARNTTQQQGG